MFNEGDVSTFVAVVFVQIKRDFAVCSFMSNDLRRVPSTSYNRIMAIIMKTFYSKLWPVISKPARYHQATRRLFLWSTVLLRSSVVQLCSSRHCEYILVAGYGKRENMYKDKW